MPPYLKVLQEVINIKKDSLSSAISGIIWSACPSLSTTAMSGTGARENVFATRMALTNTKLRLKGAQTGHSLLAKKRDALTTRFRAILRKVDEVRHPFVNVIHDLLINLALGKEKDGKSHAACFVLHG